MCTLPLKCVLWPSVFLQPLKGKWLKTACWETPDPKRLSLLPEQSIVAKVDSEVTFEISYGDNTRRTEPFQKNCFWLCQPVYSLSYLVLCAGPRLPAWYVRSRALPRVFPCCNLASKHTFLSFSCVVPPGVSQGKRAGEGW